MTDDEALHDAGEAFEVLRDEALGLFEVLAGAAAGTGAGESTRRLGAARERLAAGRLSVVVCGEFKRGKSTLLNALLGEQRPLLPVDTVIATRLVTTVAWAETESVTVVLEGADGGPEQRRAISREQIAEYVTELGNPQNVKRALLLEILTPNPRLRSGIRWVDTPGVGGMFEEHTAATMAYLPTADAVLFVADTTKPLTQSELTFLRSATTAAQVADDPDGQLYVLTRTDTVGDVAPHVQDMRAKVAAATGRPAGSVEVVPVSATAQLHWLASGDELDREVAGFDRLEAVIWSTLHRRRTTLLLGGALAELDVTAQALLGPVDTAIEALRKDGTAELATLREQIAAKQRRLQVLRQGSGAWTGELHRKVAELGGLLKRRATAGLNEVWQRVATDYMYRNEFLDDTKRLVGQITTDASMVVGGLNDLAAREASRVLAEVAARSELQLTRPRLATLPNPPVPTLAVTGGLGAADRPNRMPARLREMGWASSTGGTLGGAVGYTVGAIIGTLVAPGPGTVAGAQFGAWIVGAIGTLWGASMGWQHSRNEEAKADREARRRSLTQELAALRQGQQAHIEQELAELQTGLTQALAAELTSRIKQELESADETVKRLERQREGSVAESERRLGELRAEREPLQKAATRIAELTKSAATLAGR
ncbi:dynamin family protein [Dactylosporangium sp. CS-047395]|uniref:dynamin family protein n=1 Tax=Dactylosporangium sp. CS-047395 TaxID=3239936 RepID=UPI003D91C5CF